MPGPVSDTPSPAPRRPPRPDAWALAALGIAALVLLPLGSVLVLALRPGGASVWPHLLSTALPRYAGNTLALMAGTALVTGIVGTGTAWLVAMHRFPGRGWMQWALLLPLAVPAYVSAFALADLLDYAGPVQGTLRRLGGWGSPAEYWFPEIRSRGGAVLVLSAALAPYVHLLARAAFREQSAAGHEVARALGVGAWGRLARVGLPLARPAIAAGVALVMMETVADYGTVSLLGVPTLTTGIFTVWLQAGDVAGAAQIALCLLAAVGPLALLERRARSAGRRHAAARGHRPVEPVPLPGWRGGAAALACLLPILLGFVLPVSQLLRHALRPGAWGDPALLRALLNSAGTAAAASLLVVALALVAAAGAELARGGLARRLLPLLTLGYAVPGAVLGVGLLLPLAALDHLLADLVEAATGRDIGLLLTGSAAAVVLGCVLRFFAVGLAGAEAGLARVPPSLPLAARSLGRGAGGAMREVQVPLLRGTLGAAWLLVFVDCVKELPATLLLRPFGFETLATRAHAGASLSNLPQAVPPALAITALGLGAVLLLARASR